MIHLSTKKTPLLWKDRIFQTIYIYEVYLKNKGDEDKVSQALAEDDGRRCDIESSQ